MKRLLFALVLVAPMTGCIVSDFNTTVGSLVSLQGLYLWVSGLLGTG